MNFQVTAIVKYIVVTVCLLFIAFVIWKLYRDNLAVSSETAVYWPPEINRCPDYWTYKSDGKCHNDDFDFTIDPLIGNVTESELILRCDEINNNELYTGVAWEGIDNLC